MKRKAINCDEFVEFLLKRSEGLDDEIIRSLHPTDSWVGDVSRGAIWPEDDTLEAVRKLSEGIAYTPTVHPESGDGTFERFETAFPDLSGCWTDTTTDSCVGAPCDPGR